MREIFDRPIKEVAAMSTRTWSRRGAAVFPERAGSTSS
jgi:hypothetical protein